MLFLQEQGNPDSFTLAACSLCKVYHLKDKYDEQYGWCSVCILLLTDEGCVHNY